MPEQRPPLWSYGALAVAVVAVSSSALLVRWAEAGALSLSFWRTAGGAGVLAVPAAVAWARRRHHDTGPGARPGGPGPSGTDRVGVRTVLLLVSGLALALHFASWLASLELTSVAASVTLVTTTPLLLALALVAVGRAPIRATWIGIGLGVVGTAVIAGADWRAGGDALAGDALALVGAAAMGLYLLAGDRLRTGMDTTTYALIVYAIAAVVLGPLALVVDGGLGGYDATTWLAIVGLIVGPQLAGHTVLNLLLRPLGPVTISLALLTESIGATLGAWVLLAEAPPAGAVVGGPLVLAGLAVHLRGQSTSRRAASSA